MPIRLKRAYEAAEPGDGVRILVERLWPRGLAKSAAAIDLWSRDTAPTADLRKWFGHRPERWDEFRRRYFAELGANEDALAKLRAAVAAGPVTFVFASRERRFNNAVALKEFLEQGPSGC